MTLRLSLWREKSAQSSTRLALSTCMYLHTRAHTDKDIYGYIYVRVYTRTYTYLHIYEQVHSRLHVHSDTHTSIPARFYGPVRAQGD